MGILNGGSRIAVGSVPHMDPAASVRFQCQAFPEVPSWPQMPKRSPKERLTHQGLSGLPGIQFKPDGSAVWHEPSVGWKALSESFSGDRRAGRLETAALNPDEAAGFFSFLEEGPRYFRPEKQAVKGQCAGPVSLGFALKMVDGKSILTCPDAMSALTEFLTLQALWQARRLSEMGLPVVMFIDEPSLGGFQPEKAGLTWETVGSWFQKILEPLQTEGFLTGFHACGKGPYRWAFETTAEFIHVDVHRYQDMLLEESESLDRHLRQGGMLVFGLVPTAMSGGTFPDPAFLVEQWMAFAHTASRRGVDPALLAAGSVFSTSCGLGGGSLAVAEEASRCLSGLVSLWKITSKVGFLP
jgi:hypothetical protein